MELNPAGRETSAPNQWEGSTKNASSSCTEANKLSPVPQSPAIASSAPTPLESEDEVRKQGCAPAESTQARTMHDAFANARNTRIFLCVGAAALLTFTAVRPIIPKMTAAGCDADMLSFLRDLDLEQHASAFCSQGYTRMADVLHMTHDMYGSPAPENCMLGSRC